jgi:uncharacterized ferredoxin-like protein
MPKIYVNEWPPGSPEQEAKADNVRLAAKLMINAALSAPNPAGASQIEAHLTYGREEMNELAKKMEELANANPQNKLWAKMFKYEAVAIREQTDAVVFLGNYQAASQPFDAIGCGRCGGVLDECWVYSRRIIRSGQIDLTENTSTTLVDGPLCLMRISALGFAVGAALWIASRLLVDSRPFMSVGIAGQKLGYCPNSPIVVGLPVSAYSKNPYVDFIPDYHIFSEHRAVAAVRKWYGLSRQLLFHDYRSWDPLAESQEAEEEE